MKTVIFILALTAIVAPVFSAEDDAIACPNNNGDYANCRNCLSNTASPAAAKSTGCYDCNAGYYLNAARLCVRCTAGMGLAAGTSTAGTSLGTAKPAAPQSCTACDATCAECLAPASATGCTKCAIGKFSTTAFTAGTGATCGGTCTAGKTRDVAAADLSGAAEVEATICVNCNDACAECMGTAATKCTKCKAGYYLSAKAAAGDAFGTCSWCTGGMGKDADASAFTATTAASASAADGCKTACTAASGCGTCSAAKPAECLACATGSTLDATAKTCKKTETPATSSATLIQALCGASVAAYALF